MHIKNSSLDPTAVQRKVIVWRISVFEIGFHPDSEQDPKISKFSTKQNGAPTQRDNLPWKSRGPQLRGSLAGDWQWASEVNCWETRWRCAWQRRFEIRLHFQRNFACETDRQLLMKNCYIWIFLTSSSRYIIVLSNLDGREGEGMFGTRGEKMGTPEFPSVVNRNRG